MLFEAVGTSELHVLVHIEIPHGRPATALELSFDLDRNGRLDPNEEAQLSKHLTARAQHGVSLLVDTRPVRLMDAKSEMKRGPKGGFELMVYGKLDVGSGRTVVRVHSEATAEPTELVLLGGTRPVLEGFGRPQSDGSFRANLPPASKLSFELGPG